MCFRGILSILFLFPVVSKAAAPVSRHVSSSAVPRLLTGKVKLYSLL